MTELVDDHRQVLLVVRRAQQVGVVEAAPAVDVGIGQDDDVLVGDTRQGIVHRLEAARRQVALAVEGVEVRAEGRAGPLPEAGHRHARLLRGREDGHDVEALAVALEGLVGEDRLRGGLGILEEGRQLSLRVALGEDRQVDAVCRRARVDEVLLAVLGLGAVPVDKYILGVDALRLLGDQLIVCAAQLEGHQDGALGPGHEDDLLIGAVLALGLIRQAPLLVERVEGGAVDQAPCGLIPHPEAGVALQGQAVEVMTAPRPYG